MFLVYLLLIRWPFKSFYCWCDNFWGWNERLNNRNKNILIIKQKEKENIFLPVTQKRAWYLKEMDILEPTVNNTSQLLNWHNTEFPGRTTGVSCRLLSKAASAHVTHFLLVTQESDWYLYVLAPTVKNTWNWHIMEFRGKTIGVWWRLLSKAASVRVMPPESLLVGEGLEVMCKSCSGLDKNSPECGLRIRKFFGKWRAKEINEVLCPELH